MLSKTTRHIAAACVLGLAGTAMLAPPAQAQAAAARGLPDFTELVEQVGPSVVNIRTSEKVRASAPGQGSDEEMQELFRRFFGVPIPNAPRQSPRQSRPNALV